MMGDRANVFFPDPVFPGRGVYLYGHWSGYRLAQEVREALALEARWTDVYYLTRIVFSRMTKGKEFGETTSFGISAHRPDNEYPILMVDTTRQRVEFHPEPKDFAADPIPGDPAFHSWTFGEYVALDPATLQKLWEATPREGPVSAWRSFFWAIEEREAGYDDQARES